ncbi:amino acid permease [Neoasaia chiangmaiensis]|nr:amino acid permease [Neoasaia chiangmaiensis]
MDTYTTPRTTSKTATVDSPLIVGGKLKDRHIAMIALGGVIGAGLFVGSSAAIASAGPAVLLTYVATGLLVVLVMRMLGEMLLFRPGIGTFVDCIRAAHGGGAAFLAGWLYCLFWVVAVGAEAIAGAVIVQDWIALPVWLLAPLLIVAVNLVNVISVDLFGECEFWLSSIKVFSLLAFAALGVTALTHLIGPAFSPIANLTAAHGPLPHGWGAAIAAVPTVLFSMIGSESATVAAAESENARDNLARITRRIGLRLTLFYLLAIAFILTIVPWTTVRPGLSPFVTVMQALGVPGATLAVSIVVFSAVVSCLNSSLYITSRTLFGLAEKGDAPRAFTVTNRRAVPQRAVLAASAIGLAVAFSSILSPGIIFAFLLSATGAVILLVYALIVSAHWTMRRSDPSNPAFTLPFGPLPNILIVLAIAAIIVTMAFQPSQRSTVFSSLGSVVLFVALYVLRRQRVKKDLP